MSQRSEDLYVITSHCDLCGRKLWKGYFLMVPDEIQSMAIKVVCWRCKLFGKKNA
ncbi:MAG TPA: hypothetical protein VLY20_07340 [Nitrospiria bacterium]|nr:hypothetical protein [Nitrospiria bacterium]HUK56455.1 hypothetical protein [Nitrospiria bacterium]